MTTPVHQVPSRAFRELSEGAGGGAAAGWLVAAQYSKHALLVRTVVGLAASSGHRDADTATRAYGQLADIQRARPDAVAAVIRHPATGARAKRTAELLSAPETAADASPGWMMSLAAAAAIRADTPLSATLPVTDGWIILPSLGRAAASDGKLRVSAGRVDVDGTRLPLDRDADSASWQRLRRLSAASDSTALTALIDDIDPYRARDADNPSDRLSAAELADWQPLLQDAWNLLVSRHAEVAAEIAAMISVLTPLCPPQGGQVSATSRDTFGAILLSRPTDATALAVTMAHEIQHAKLSALLDLLAMTSGSGERRFYAPWRDDPRPASGLLQGAYAFLGVAGFWLRESRLPDGEAALAEFARWVSAVRTVVDTLLASGQLTEAGQAFVSGIDRTLTRWEAVPVPDEARAAARDANDEHQEQWRQRHGEIPSRG
ncbi:MAG TPA: HEXXH motif domain-containing protein [Trebonia sp.]|nr:HEXXH motif domain-containing protein [Trebonia sp.]